MRLGIIREAWLTFFREGLRFFWEGMRFFREGLIGLVTSKEFSDGIRVF